MRTLAGSDLTGFKLFKEIILDYQVQAAAKPDILTLLGSRSRYNRCLYMGICMAICGALVFGIWVSGDPSSRGLYKHHRSHSSFSPTRLAEPPKPTIAEPQIVDAVGQAHGLESERSSGPISSEYGGGSSNRGNTTVSDSSLGGSSDSSLGGSSEGDAEMGTIYHSGYHDSSHTADGDLGGDSRVADGGGLAYSQAGGSWAAEGGASLGADGSHMAMHGSGAVAADHPTNATAPADAAPVTDPGEASANHASAGQANITAAIAATEGAAVALDSAAAGEAPDSGEAQGQLSNSKDDSDVDDYDEYGN